MYLIVDNDHMVREIISQQFEALGYEISQLNAGLAALARLNAGACRYPRLARFRLGKDVGYTGFCRQDGVARYAIG